MSSKSGKTTITSTSIAQRRERIFSELSDLIPLEGENAINQQGTKTFYSHNSSPKLSVPLDDETFEIMAEELTCPSPRGGGNDDDSDTPMNEDVIKRSYRIMTYMVQDMQEAQNFLVNKFGDQDKYSDILYIRNLINPTRAGLLAKRLFSAYRQLVAFYQAAVDTHFHNNVQRRATDKEDNKGLTDESFILLLRQPLNNRHRPHLPHLNQTMRALLQAFPSQVIGASSRGGEKGFEQWLEPMLQLQYLLVVTWTNYKEEDVDDDGISTYLEHPATKREYSPLDIVRDMMMLGCTGIRKYASIFTSSLSQTQQTQPSMSLVDSKTLINVGHRRKFVHGLTKWGGLEKLVSIVYKDVACAQNILEALLDIVDVLLYHDDLLWNVNNEQNSLNDNVSNAKTCRGAQRRQSVGEEALLAQLASPKVIHELFEGLVANENALVYNEAISRALLGLFELATGKKSQQTQPQVPASFPGKEEDRAGIDIECKMTAKDRALNMEDNPMIKAGVTDKLHAAMCQEMKSLVKTMDVYRRGHQSSATKDSVTPHGRVVMKTPFTTTRLQLLTLFTDLVSYKCYSAAKEEHKSAVQALDTIMELPPPCETSAEMECANQPETVYNPWPGICDLLFEYPENNMLHVQFYRLIHSLCITNHEPTFKLVVQKCKFLSRAMKICCTLDKPCSTRGILLRCLNALRLHSESISPHSFLRHYLESHDGWKGMQDEIRRMTIEQEQRGGGISVPTATGDKSVTTSKSDVDIGLGSEFAISLGFPHYIQPYNLNANDGTKKKTKKKKSKNKAS